MLLPAWETQWGHDVASVPSTIYQKYQVSKLLINEWSQSRMWIHEWNLVGLINALLVPPSHLRELEVYLESTWCLVGCPVITLNKKKRSYLHILLQYERQLCFAVMAASSVLDLCATAQRQIRPPLKYLPAQFAAVVLDSSAQSRLEI